MANHKPLPHIPTTTTGSSTIPTGTLSGEFRTHRTRLLGHVLGEIEQVAGHKDGWIYLLEEVLDQLYLRLTKDNWLAGIRRGREAKLISREAPDPEQVPKDTSSEEGQVEGIRRVEGVKKSSKDTLSLELIDEINNTSPLEQIRKLASRPASPSSAVESSHLLICVAPYSGGGPLLSEDSGFDLIPANIGCMFDPGTFTIDANGSNVLFGVEGWKGSDRLVGGTFTFKGLTSLEQHNILARLLRLAIYIQLSMILEEHFLTDSHIKLTPHIPKPIHVSISAPSRRPHPQESSPPKVKGPLGFLNILARKSLSFSRPRSPIPSNTHPLGTYDTSQAPLSWAETGFRLRRLSFIGTQAPRIEREPGATFSLALKALKGSQTFFSTSPGVSFDPPLLLSHLAEKEEQNPRRRLKGDEKVGLRSLLGWDGREARGKGMSGITGLVRQQGISVLISQHVASILPSSPEASSGSEATSGGTSSALSPASPQSLRLCGKPRWVTYSYFSHDPDKDKTLGEALQSLVRDRNLPCDQAGCRYSRGQHHLRLIHGGVQIVVTIEDAVEDVPSESVIRSWESCSLCDFQTSPVELSDGSWLFSFAKFLELVVYSPNLCNIASPVCEHLGVPFNIVRHFSTRGGSVRFATSPIEDIFELHVPRIQIQSGADKLSRTPTTSTVSSDVQEDDVDGDKRILRREIRQWWEGVSDYVDQLEKVVLGDELAPKTGKALPRLPSGDDAYEFESSTPSAFSKASSSTTPSQLTSQDTPVDGVKEDYFVPPQPPTIPEESVLETPLPTPLPPSVPPKDNLAERLANLRHCLQRLEQNLYIQLAQSPASSLNDVRRSFLAAARGTRKRLTAWKKKHLGSKISLTDELNVPEPQWWDAGCHAVPGTNIIVRENDWGSIIAFTLGSKDYRNELANLAFRRTPPLRTETPASTAPPSSFFSVASGYRFFTSQSDMQPDPDQDDAVWHDVEPYSAVIMRKEHTRDPTSILSIRDVLRKNTIPIEQLGIGSQPQGSSGAPVISTRAKPDIGVSMQDADGEVIPSSQEDVESVEKLLHELEQVSAEPSETPPTHPPSVMSDNTSAFSAGQIDGHVRRQHNSSVLSLSSGSDATIGKGASTFVAETSSFTGEEPEIPPVPPKDPPIVPPKEVDGDATLRASPNPTVTASSFATTIASSILKLVMNTPEATAPSPPPRHHGLLNTDIEAIDERPHIKYDWTIGKRLKFSCTVFYAKQFDSLRRSCGIDDIFIKSLSRSSNWAAEGGKSKSNFWKTSDERFIIKTLVNAWNVADLQFLIDLAPAYFRYMESTASKATVLAKLFGFYTIEIRNLETGAVQSKVDLLIMENLFYGQKISKTFDLKGIQGRKVKASNANGETTKTLFDGEWIEGQQKTPMLVRPHSKRILHEAIKSDAEFLARSNIMDYSLLLGVDETKKEIVCGLVDTIGSYTFAKTLQYKAKQGLQSGKEVTVVPPADYQERFVKALEGYFVACPDKWSKPLDESRTISDPNQLPSVL